MTDEATGLPALPDNQFWRIKPFGAGGGWLTIALMERYSIPAVAFYEFQWRRLRRVRVAVPYLQAQNGSRSLHESIFNPTFESFFGAPAVAKRILDERALYGDYPPKKWSDD